MPAAAQQQKKKGKRSRKGKGKFLRYRVTNRRARNALKHVRASSGLPAAIAYAKAHQLPQPAK